MKDWGISASSLTLSDIVAVVVVVLLMLDAGCWLAAISGGRDSARWTGTWQRDQIAPLQHGSSQGRGAVTTAASASSTFHAALCVLSTH
jgi:hypothetical protein